MNVDFADLKSRVTIEQVVQLLNLQLKPKGEQLRGPCPACKEGGDRAIVVTPSMGVAYCFAAKKGGDLIWLAYHILGVSVREAAIYIAEHLTVPQKSRDEERTPPSGHLEPLQGLTCDHIAVQNLGLGCKDAEAAGIGWCKKGLMRNRIAFPIRLPDGTLVGYVGYDPEDGTLKVPPKGFLL